MKNQKSLTEIGKSKNRKIEKLKIFTLEKGKTMKSQHWKIEKSKHRNQNFWKKSNIVDIIFRFFDFSSPRFFNFQFLNFSIFQLTIFSVGMF